MLEYSIDKGMVSEIDKVLGMVHTLCKRTRDKGLRADNTQRRPIQAPHCAIKPFG
jgi:hypothetical protein